MVCFLNTLLRTDAFLTFREGHLRVRGCRFSMDGSRVKQESCAESGEPDHKRDDRLMFLYPSHLSRDIRLADRRSCEA